MKNCTYRVGLALTALALLGFTRPCPAATQLAFRTPPGAVSIPLGQSRDLGAVNVHDFQQIRLVADERTGSAGNIVIRLTVTEGNELVALLDTITLTPHSQVTRVYDIPGNALTISAEAVGSGSGAAAADVLIFGHAP